MRRVVLALLSLALSFTLGPSVAAVSTTTSDAAVVKTESPFIITNYASTGSQLHFVQFYNESPNIQRLDGWSIEYDLSDEMTTQTVQLPVVLSGYVAPSNYIIVADIAMNFGSPFEYISAESTGE